MNSDERKMLADALKRYHDCAFTPGVYEHSIVGQAALILENHVEVKHGRWELIEKAGVDYWRCSACGKIRSEYYYEPKDNYCPNCGAKMDGDGNDI